MRRVNFKQWIPAKVDKSTSTFKKKEGTGCWEEGFSGFGLFHRWGVSYEEHENGFGNYTVALVELDDGTIEEVVPTRLKFINPS